MQFVKQGPDIPERLLQAHEEGRVVLFCGAGVSYPAGLPSFGLLVDKIYEELGVTPDLTQAAAIKARQYDTALALLESNVFGKREMVRRALASVLTPNFAAPDAIRTHRALLTLARSRNSRGAPTTVRLITTNFDRIFERVIEEDRLEVPTYSAPLLPVPKSRWNGLVYLHGLIPATPTTAELNKLVVSSGDFGLAYLTERWAARFVTDLFRNYVVCFVGYSINDPVLRYMMDALAADKMLGETAAEVNRTGNLGDSLV